MRLTASIGKSALIAFAASFLVGGAAQAAQISGSLSFFPFTNGSYTGADIQDASSITVATPEYIGTGQNGFSAYSFPDTLTMATLPTFAATGTLVTEADSVPNLIEFGTNGGGPRFEFDLTSLGEIYSGTGTLTLYGSGILRDTTGAFDPTPAEFTGNGFNDLGAGSFSSSSFTFAAVPSVPEPVSLGFLATSAVLFMRRRRV